MKAQKGLVLKMDKYIGKRLDGRYEIQEVIGVGGMAVVYKAYDSIDDRVVAVKILKEEFVANDEFLRRFKNESKAIAVLSHPNIVKVFDVSFGDNIQYIVMEYIDGITLKEYIERQGILAWKDAIYFTVQILHALQHAHEKGIVHRDVKPQNIMLLHDGTIKVADFGIARFARSEQRTITDKAIGSVHYISPEQARGDAIDEKADLYSVGVLLYEMLTGQLPFQADSAVSVAIMQLQTEPKPLRDINGSIPLGLEQITMRAMRKDPNKRYSTDAEMLRDLDEFKRDPSTQFRYEELYADNSPTRYVTAPVAQEDVSKKVDELYTDTDDNNTENEERKAPIVPALAGIAAALVICLAIFSAIFIPRMFLSRTPDVRVPTLIGKDYEEMKKETKDSLNIVVKEWQFNDQYSYGIIFEQDIEANKSVKKGTTVNVVVSSGKKSMQLPDVYDMEVTEAIQVLKDSDLKVKQVEVTDEEIEKDHVVRTSPQRFSNVSAGTEIKVYVSMGKPIRYVRVPNILDISRELATEKLETASLKLGEVTHRDSDKPEGTVLSQSKNEGAQVGEGSAIDIVISTGVPTQNVRYYTFEINVKKPDYYKDTYTISATLGNSIQRKSSSTADSYNFTFTTSETQGTIKVMVDTELYQEYSFSYGVPKFENEYVLKTEEVVQ